jgi:hypothetical protein
VDVADRVYRLIVAGELSDHLESGFDCMRLTRVDGNTALTGNVRDQAALDGLLRRVSDLGLALLEVKVIDDGPSASALRSLRAERDDRSRLT